MLLALRYFCVNHPQVNEAHELLKIVKAARRSAKGSIQAIQSWKTKIDQAASNATDLTEAAENIAQLEPTVSESRELMSSLTSQSDLLLKQLQQIKKGNH